jgi:acyl dehydratase
MPKLEKGNKFQDFHEGQKFEHHWGRTISAGENSTFSSITMNFNPAHFNADYAASIGYDREIVNPLFVLCNLIGLSVEDLSEGAGPFLGIENVKIYTEVYPGDTIYCESKVVSKRESKSRPGYGIVKWHCQGYNQDETLVMEYDRINLVEKRADN